MQTKDRTLAQKSAEYDAGYFIEPTPQESFALLLSGAAQRFQSLKEAADEKLRVALKDIKSKHGPLIDEARRIYDKSLAVARSEGVSPEDMRYEEKVQEAYRYAIAPATLDEARARNAHEDELTAGSVINRLLMSVGEAERLPIRFQQHLEVVKKIKAWTHENSLPIVVAEDGTYAHAINLYNLTIKQWHDTMEVLRESAGSDRSFAGGLVEIPIIVGNEVLAEYNELDARDFVKIVNALEKRAHVLYPKLSEHDVERSAVNRDNLEPARAR